MIDTRRRLPHWVPDGVPVFVTFRLAGTVPGRARRPRALPGGAGFSSIDQQLDRAESGPVWLKNEPVAQMLVEALLYGAMVKQWYALHAYVIMPNHVHIVWTPTGSMSRRLQWLKSVTAKRAKGILHLTDKAFWQDESYDHWVRSDSELQKIIRYVEWNPAKAGLAGSVGEWRWSSAYAPGMADGKTVCPTPEQAQSIKAP